MDWANDPPWYRSLKYFRDREDVRLDDAVGQVIESLKNLVCRFVHERSPNFSPR
jgi:hypothetical protein